MKKKKKGKKTKHYNRVKGEEVEERKKKTKKKTGMKFTGTEFACTYLSIYRMCVCV